MTDDADSEAAASAAASNRLNKLESGGSDEAEEEQILIAEELNHHQAVIDSGISFVKRKLVAYVTLINNSRTSDADNLLEEHNEYLKIWSDISTMLIDRMVPALVQCDDLCRNLHRLLPFLNIDKNDDDEFNTEEVAKFFTHLYSELIQQRRWYYVIDIVDDWFYRYRLHSSHVFPLLSVNTLEIIFEERPHMFLQRLICPLFDCFDGDSQKRSLLKKILNKMPADIHNRHEYIGRLFNYAVSKFDAGISKGHKYLVSYYFRIVLSIDEVMSLLLSRGVPHFVLDKYIDPLLMDEFLVTDSCNYTILHNAVNCSSWSVLFNENRRLDYFRVVSHLFFIFDSRSNGRKALHLENVDGNTVYDVAHRRGLFG